MHLTIVSILYFVRFFLGLKMVNKALIGFSCLSFFILFSNYLDNLFFPGPYDRALFEILKENNYEYEENNCIKTISKDEMITQLKLLNCKNNNYENFYNKLKKTKNNYEILFKNVNSKILYKHNSNIMIICGYNSINDKNKDYIIDFDKMDLDKYSHKFIFDKNDKNTIYHLNDYNEDLCKLNIDYSYIFNNYKKFDNYNY